MFIILPSNPPHQYLQRRRKYIFQLITECKYIIADSFIIVKINYNPNVNHLVNGWTIVVHSYVGSILKSRDITLPKKVPIVKSMIFPVVMYRCECWTIKKAECWRIDTLNCGVWEDSWTMIQQSHCWAYTLRKPEGKETRVPQCSSQHCL